MIKVKLRGRVLLALGLTFAIGSSENVLANELDHIKQLVQQASSTFLGDMEFVQHCMGMPATPELCDAADTPGTPARSVACPGPTRTVQSPHVCDMLRQARLTAILGIKGNQLLRFAGKFKLVFAMIGEEKSIPNHLHQPDSTQRSCADQYLKRQDQVKVIFAAFQEGKVTAQPPTQLSQITAYLAEVEAVKNSSFEHGPNFYCIRVTHSQPLSCSGELSEPPETDRPETERPPSRPSSSP